jgi:isopentenyl phosphate kinase
MKKTLILKLGGSIVTYKDRPVPTIRQSLIGKIGGILANTYNPARHQLILIHGAGSFGHQHAHKHKLSQGTKGHPEKAFRAIENQSLDALLNAKITSILIHSGLKVVGMPTRTLAINASGGLHSLETGSIRAALDAHAIPLLHGDMVFDTAWGFSICSGDVLTPELARQFSTNQAFFASDVDGIFSQDPHQFPDATLIEKTTLAEISEGTLRLSTSHNIDVTGGLSQKFSLFKKVTSLENIYLFNGLQPENFSFVFDQTDFFGTTVRVKKAGRG